MKQAMHVLVIEAPKASLLDISDHVKSWLAEQSVSDGLLTLFCQHTSASLLMQENAAPAARRDVERYFARIAPENAEYEHDDEGSDDMPAHLRAALTSTQLSIPVSDGRPMVGQWQGIYLFEHRRQPSPRRVVLHLIGE